MSIVIKTIDDIRANSFLMFAHEWKPTLSPLKSDAEKKADALKRPYDDFLSGKEEAFLLNANHTQDFLNVEISSEGAEQYDQNKDFLKDHVVISDKYYEAKFNYAYNRMIEQNFINRRDTSFDDRANCIVSTYAKAYDEIVQGYLSGSRELYVVDNNTENGFRKLTMEDELDSLRKEAYQEMEILDQQIKNYESWDQSTMNVIWKARAARWSHWKESGDDKKDFSGLKQRILSAISMFETGYQVGESVDSLIGKLTIQSPEKDS